MGRERPLYHIFSQQCIRCLNKEFDPETMLIATKARCNGYIARSPFRGTHCGSYDQQAESTEMRDHVVLERARAGEISGRGL